MEGAAWPHDIGGNIFIMRNKTKLAPRMFTTALMHRREFLISAGTGALGVAVATFLKGCGGSSGGETNGTPPSTSTSNLTIMTNPKDPLLLTAKLNDSRIVEYFGTRDVNGIPISVDHIFIRSTNGDVSRYQLDSTGRPIKIVALNGTRFLMQWTSTMQVAVSILSSDGTTQVNITVDLAQVPTQPVAATTSFLSESTTNLGRRPRSGGISLQTSQISTGLGTNPSVLGSAMAAAAVSGNGICTVRVTTCGNPEDSAECYVDILTTNQNPLGEFPAKNVGGGAYQATIPVGTAPISSTDWCSSLADLLGNICNVAFAQPGAAEYVCLLISETLAALAAINPAIVPFIPAIVEACAAITTSLDVYCNTAGGGPGPTFAERLCAATEEHRTFIDDVILKPRVIAVPRNIGGAPVPSRGQGPFPELSVELGFIPNLKPLIVMLPSPNAISYKATGEMSCLPAGTTVTLSVVRKGYSDKASTTVPSSQSEYVVTLTVPVPKTRVQDTLTLVVETPDGETLSRTAYLSVGNDIAGTYTGTFSGDDSGTFTITISENGSISGNARSASGETFSLSGTASDSTGTVTFGGITGEAAFKGTIQSGAVSGTWSNTSTGESGSFTGTGK